MKVIVKVICTSQEGGLIRLSDGTESKFSQNGEMQFLVESPFSVVEQSDGISVSELTH